MVRLDREEMTQVWKPGVYWEKSIEVKVPPAGELIDNGAGQSFTISPDGTVFWSSQTTFILACKMDLTRLPFDTQTCTYTMGVYAETAAEVNLVWRPGHPAIENWNTTCVTAFVVSNLTQSSQTARYVESSYTYAVAAVSFTRDPQPLIMSYFIPAVFLVCISMLGFFIDPAATPARVALGIITILAVVSQYT